MSKFNHEKDSIFDALGLDPEKTTIKVDSVIKQLNDPKNDKPSQLAEALDSLTKRELVYFATQSCITVAERTAQLQDLHGMLVKLETLLEKSQGGEPEQQEG